MSFANEIPKFISQIFPVLVNVIWEKFQIKKYGNFMLVWPWFTHNEISVRMGFAKNGSPHHIYRYYCYWALKRKAVNVNHCKWLAKEQFVRHSYIKVYIWLQFRIWLRMLWWCVQCYTISYLKSYIFFPARGGKQRWRFKIVHIIFGNHKCHIFYRRTRTLHHNTI